MHSQLSQLAVPTALAAWQVRSAETQCGCLRAADCGRPVYVPMRCMRRRSTVCLAQDERGFTSLASVSWQARLISSRARPDSQVSPARHLWCAGGMDRPDLELLWAALRIGQWLDLDIKEFIRCSFVCKSFADAVRTHVTRLDCQLPYFQTKSWWQPDKLASVQGASLHTLALPAAAQLSQLRSLEISGPQTWPVQLRPLSALKHLTTLSVADSPAMGLEHLPSLRSLDVHPRWPSQMRLLGRQTELTALRLHTAGGEACFGAEADRWTAAEAWQGLQRLSGLEEISLESWHLSRMQAQTLCPCTALRRLEIEYLYHDAHDASEDEASCSLSALTLHVVCLRNMSCEDELEALKTAAMPGLHSLVLERPSEFVGTGVVPRVAVPLLDVRLGQQSWCVIAAALGDLAAMHRRAHREQRPSFSVLRLSGWPADPAPAAQETAIQARLFSFMRRDVQVQSASSADPAKLHEFVLPPEVAAAEYTSSDSE